MKIIKYIIFIFLLISNLKAQTEPLLAPATDNLSESGLLISLNNKTFSSSGSIGGGFGFVTRLSKQYWLRFSAGYDYQNETTEKPQYAETDYILKNFTIDFRPALINHLLSNKTTSLYTGFFGLFSYNNKNNIGENFKSKEIDDKSFGAGFGLLLGAEWRIDKKIGISFEYSMPFLWSWGKNVIKSGSNYQEQLSPRIFKTGIKSSEAALILTYYF